MFPPSIFAVQQKSRTVSRWRWSPKIVTRGWRWWKNPYVANEQLLNQMFLNLLFGGFTCLKVSKPPKQGLQPYGVLRCFEQKRRSTGKKTRMEAWKALPEKLTSEDKDKDGPGSGPERGVGGHGGLKLEPGRCGFSIWNLYLRGGFKYFVYVHPLFG